MNIGIIHNYYRSTIPSGENLTVDNIIKILKELGHDVSLYSESSDQYENQKRVQFRRVLHLFGIIRNTNFEKWISDKDVVQIHNYFPLIGKIELKIILKKNIPVIRVIHNFRKSCLSGNHFRNNLSCTKCTPSDFSSGVINRCYQKSLLKSLLSAWHSKKINKFELNKKLQYIAISDAVAVYLQNLDINPDRVRVISNGVSKHQIIDQHANEILFASRLEPEKGANLIFETWRRYPGLPTLNIVGTGTQNQLAVDLSKDLSNVNYHGLVSEEKVEQIAMGCRIVLSPILWDEPFGRIFVEALARGQGLVTTRRGLAKSIIVEGFNGYFCEYSPESLRFRIDQAMDLDLAKQVETSIKIWRNSFSQEKAKELWKEFYSEMKSQIDTK